MNRKNVGDVPKTTANAANKKHINYPEGPILKNSTLQKSVIKCLEKLKILFKWDLKIFLKNSFLKT